jgi:hypothetical protein
MNSQRFCPIAAKLTLLAGIMTLSVAPADGHTLCGEKYSSRSELEMKLEARSNIQIFHGGHIKTLWESNVRKLWWLSESGHPAFPSLVCEHQIDRNGEYRNIIQSDCSGSSTKACKQLVKDFSKVKF